ncbi:MAG TPA: polysaccharide biosynthesis tyrosine autokinase [Gemmataceae bacterium]|nr:polysaccharide biosynthesis tyrosine autokinase [Gemmataceae bacterium]
MLPRESQKPDSPRRPAAQPIPVAGVVAPPAPRLRTAPAQRPAALSSSPDLPAILKSLRRRWLLAAGLTLLLAPAAAVGAWFLLSAKYTAFAQIHMASVPPWLVAKNVDTPEGRSEFGTFQKTQATRLKGRLVLNTTLARDDVKRLRLVREQADPITWLEDELKVEAPDGSEVMTVSLSANDPNEPLTLVQGVVKSYEEQVVNTERDRRQARVHELEGIYTKTDTQLRQDKEEYRRRVEKLSTGDKDVVLQQQVALMADVTEAKRQYAQARQDRMNAERRLATHKAIEKAVKDTPISEPDLAALVEADPVAKGHQVRGDKLRQIIKEYEHSGAAKDEPTLVRAREQAAEADKALEERRTALRKDLAQRAGARAKAEYEAVLAQLAGEVEALTGQEQVAATRVKELEQQVPKLAAQMSKFGAAPLELEMLRAQVDRETKYSDKIWDELELLRAELGSPPRVRILQEAALAKKDIKRQVAGAVGAPLFVMILIGLGVGLWEFRARRIRSAEEVAVGLGIRVVGAVPALQAQADPAEQEGALESIDAIRTLLLHDAGVEAARVVMVTSAGSGEGKTTLACSLADSLARAGRKTLLIDCDLRGPSAHQMFELPLQPGFSEVLLGEIDAADAVQATPVAGLSLITAGQWDREVLRSLAREGALEIFDKLKLEYDFVVVDSHPVLEATDSLLLGRHVDAVLLSVLRDVSRSPRVYTASQRLATLGVRLLGAVVNGADADDVYAGAGVVAQAV